MTPKGYIWIYDPETKEFRELPSNDKRLDFSRPHSPVGQVPFRLRLNAKKWHYVYWGVTINRAAQAANRAVREDISILEKKIFELREKLVLPFE